MQKGKIININSTKYLVDVNGKVFDTVLRGIFRKDKITPLVGDIVDIDENQKQIVKIYERKNYLLRPNVANIDYALIITSVKKPDLDLVLLDKLLVHSILSNIKPVIVFSKIDLLNDEEYIKYLKIKKYYKNYYEVFENTDITLIENFIKNKVVVTTGQTGAGKSSFLNKLDSTLNLLTSPISESLNRGVHTTRMVSLYKIKNYFIVDTPGFSSLDLKEYSKESIKNSFLEFNDYNCKYNDCSHINTGGCEVENKVGTKILESRYENYKKFIKESYESSSKFFK